MRREAKLRDAADLPGTRGMILHLVRTAMVRTAEGPVAGAADHGPAQTWWSYNGVQHSQADAEERS